MPPEKKMQIARTATEARRAKRNLERQQMTLRALMRDRDRSVASDEKTTIPNGQTQILIDGLNRIAAEIHNISRLLERSVEP